MPPKKLLAPPELDAHRFSVEGEEWVVFSWEPGASAQPLPKLSTSERSIIAMLVKGASNREIASHRGTTVRTVANQIAQLLKKLGVASRYELAARIGMTLQER